jgi:putative transposase
VLHTHGQVHRRGRARLPRLRGAGPNEGLNCGTTCLPTTVRGIWLYPYLVIDVWSRKAVAWDVAERKDPAIAADLESRACLRERISRGRSQPQIFHDDNGNAMRAATVESRLVELGVLRSFSMAKSLKQQPLLRIPVPYSEVPAGLPETAICQQS